ncbi:MAG TPA: hypothetical protein VFM54_09050 [Micromonosporaceae bacterium]|nr:hypothetical protein [Micromonosporaceae bacterium]
MTTPPLAQRLAPRVTPPLVRVLEADPDLARGLARPQQEHAALALAAQLWTGNAGDDAADIVRSREPEAVSLLVLDGVLAHSVTAYGSTSVGLLGCGDVYCPGEDGGVDEAAAERLVALVETRVAVLDAGFLAQAARWPAVTRNLMFRVGQRAHRLSLQLAISHMVGLERKILALLWHLADQLGSVGTEGVVVPLRLTNGLLGNLVGASGPSVSSAVANLTRQHAVSRFPDGAWLLHRSEL